MRSKAKINDEAVISGEKKVSEVSRPVLTTDTEKGTFAIDSEPDTDPADAPSANFQRSLERCHDDLLGVWLQNWTWEGLEIPLYVEEYGIGADSISMMQKEIAAAHPKPKTTSPIATEIDRYYDLNHLRVLRNTLSPLLERLGADDMPHFRKEQLTADLYNVFLEYKEVPTEKEMIIALLDVVDAILSEDIPNA